MHHKQSHALEWWMFDKIRMVIILVSCNMPSFYFILIVGYIFCRAFVNTFIQFKKPIIVAVNGPAIGLGASILPLCDVIWANEKAWFQTPYTTFGQSPDGCSSLLFPKIMGIASVSLYSSYLISQILFIGNKIFIVLPQTVFHFLFVCFFSQT